MADTPWLVRQPVVAPRLRLYCFSYAGGNASAYGGWQAGLDPAVEVCAVQLPGRGARYSEPPYRDLAALLAALATVLMAQPNVPYAFYGHSLGGLLAFELTRYLRAHRTAAPRLLLVSGCAAPSRRRRERQVQGMEDAELIETLRNYNGTPPALLEHKELMALLLPTIRADFALVDDYVYTPQAPLAVPISVLAGRGDNADVLEGLSAWQEESNQPCQVEWFEGDHFFIQSAQPAVLRHVARTIAPLLRELAAPHA